MKIIAIETSGRHGSVAALDGETGEARLIQQAVLGADPRTAQALAPSLRALLNDAGWSPQSVDLVAVAVGPGSFTGLRIGVTTAKTLAYAAGVKVIGVNTLVTLAEQAPTSAAPLWAILDAQRQELFVAHFDAADRDSSARDCDTSIISQDAWLAGLRAGDYATGPPLHRLAECLPDGVIAVPEESWQATAAALGRVAWRAYQAGQRDDVWKLAPNYYRPSYAEEKRGRNK